ncbi:MAG TPA: hypothetical protein VIW02_03350 [Gammaproteobacteria bacterium]
MTTSPPPRLRLLAGGRRAQLRYRGVRVVSAAPGQPPFPVQRTLLEEDTWQVLAADPEWAPPPAEHPLRLHTALLDQPPRATGALLDDGHRWRAVVVDLDAAPLVSPAAVARAWAAVAAACGRRRVARLAVELLGTVHGDLAPAAALEALRLGLLETPPAGLRDLWLLTPWRRQAVVEQALACWERS